MLSAGTRKGIYPKLVEVWKALKIKRLIEVLKKT